MWSVSQSHSHMHALIIQNYMRVSQVCVLVVSYLHSDVRWFMVVL